MAEIIPYLFYRDMAAALAWLAGAFGFTETMRVATAGGGMHAEMSFGGARLMMGQPEGDGHGGHRSPAVTGAATMGVFIYMDEVDTHHRHAVAAGAVIEQAPHDQPYGRTYAARDLEGHPWYFTARAAGDR